ncbi:hypothetical protein ACQP2F_23935 [Actinoplanes sp. CA-030573]
MPSEKRELICGTAWYGTAWHRRPELTRRAERADPPPRPRTATTG